MAKGEGSRSLPTLFSLTSASLCLLQAEVDSITTGDECGIGLLGFEEFEIGDVIESYVVK